MAINTYKHPEKRKSGNFFGWLHRLLSISDSLQKQIHIKFIPQFLFVMILVVIYIANRHSAERKIRTINKLEEQVEDLRADYTTLKASYMFVSKQSEVAKKAKKIGLTENNDSPILIAKE